MRKHVGRKAWSGAILAVCMMSHAQPALAAIDDLQIDWILPAAEFGARSIPSVRGRIEVMVQPLPRELFAAEADVVASDGTKLLPAGAQLYRMIGPAFMACSQSQEAEGYVGASNRVCVRDTDGDGQLDSYFTRSRGRSAITGDQMWFAMNNNLPSDMARLKPTALTRLANIEARERPEMKFEFFSDKRGRIFNAVTIGGKHRFSGRCQPERAVEPDQDSTTAACLAPGFVTRWTNLSSENTEDHMAVLEIPDRSLTVRFDVAPRLMGARLMSGVYFE